MENYQELQKRLIEKATRFHELSLPVIEAFYHYPRHEFVPSRYSAAEAYTDTALPLFKQGRAHSTISQPSFVLYLLELLKLEKNQKVFEVGTGSAWNAALISDLVGDQGLVVTMEIIPDVAKQAKENISKHNIKNVKVIEGDASFGFEAEAPYDRIIFTAAATKMPDFVSQQCRDGGRVLYVQEGEAGTDEVLVLEKRQNTFKCLQRIPCFFVAMTGSASDGSNKPPSERRRIL